MTDPAHSSNSKRQKLTGRSNDGDGDIVRVDNSFSVDEGTEVGTFDVPKRSVFLKALKLKAKREQNVVISELEFETLSKSVATASRLLNWELELGTVVGEVNIIYDGIEKEDIAASCQLQCLSKGKVERERGQLMCDSTVCNTLIYPKKYQCLSFTFSLKELWGETTDQIRVILTFPLPIELIHPPVNDVSGNETYVPSFETFFLSKELSDISVSSTSETFPAHKIVLAHCSEVFKQMVLTEMKETQEGNIILNAVGPDAVKEMLRFIYTGKLEATLEISIDIFKLAHTYAIKGLKRQILPMIVNNITLETAPKMHSFGEVYNATEIMTRALSIAKENKKRLATESEEFKILTNAYPSFMFKLCIQED